MSDEDLKIILAVLYRNNLIPYLLSDKWIFVNWIRLQTFDLSKELSKLIRIEEDVYYGAKDYKTKSKTLLDESGENII